MSTSGWLSSLKNVRELNKGSLELLYPFFLRRYAANELLKKKVRGQAEKNAQKLTAEVFSVFITF